MYRFYAIELCSASLDQLFLPDDDPKKFRWSSPVPDDRQVLLQIARGLRFIHSEGFVHRDIKPENILISLNDGPDGLIKVSDFGLSKPVSVRETFSQSQVKGTPIYMAPEFLRFIEESDSNNIAEEFRGTTKGDVFAAGCTFSCYMTGGNHPFGPLFNVPSNILQGNPINFKKG